LKNIFYIIIEETYSFNGSTRNSFGIAACCGPASDGISNIVLTINDITADKIKLTEFIEMCNCLNLSLIHIFEAVDDFLA